MPIPDVAQADGPTLLNRPFNDPYIDAMSNHWNLSQEQEIAAARLTREAVEMLTTAAERGGVEIGERGPRFVQRLIDAHFLKLEPGVHGRAVVRITEDGCYFSNGTCQGRDERILAVIGQGRHRYPAAIGHDRR